MSYSLAIETNKAQTMKHDTSNFNEMQRILDDTPSPELEERVLDDATIDGLIEAVRDGNEVHFGNHSFIDSSYIIQCIDEDEKLRNELLTAPLNLTPNRYATFYNETFNSICADILQNAYENSTIDVPQIMPANYSEQLAADNRKKLEAEELRLANAKLDSMLVDYDQCAKALFSYYHELPDYFTHIAQTATVLNITHKFGLGGKETKRMFLRGHEQDLHDMRVLFNWAKAKSDARKAA